MNRNFCLAVLLWSALVLSGRGASGSRADALEPITLGRDGKSFVQGGTARPFRVWGVNYDHDATGKNGRLLEDYWQEEWKTVEQDFAEMKELGANVVRIHLQLGKFMTGPGSPDQESLAQLTRLLALAEQTGLYLNLTGLGCYHRHDVPSWYDALDEQARWSVQARFWQAVAGTCRKSPAIFCYDLMNEPIIGGNTAEGWVTGELGGKYFVQRLTLNQGQRSAVEVAKAWSEKLTRSIRQEDPTHLITVGVIPWAQVWPGAKPVFYAPEVRDYFDFVSIHLYPKKDGVDQALTAMAVYDIGKPLVIEETFPLSCSAAEMDDFLKRSRDRVEGYFSFYWGRTRAEYLAADPPDAVSSLMAGWLEYFRRQAPFMKQP